MVKLKRFSFFISLQNRRKLKIYSMNYDVSMSKILNELIRQYAEKIKIKEESGQEKLPILIKEVKKENELI